MSRSAQYSAPSHGYAAEARRDPVGAKAVSDPVAAALSGGAAAARSTLVFRSTRSTALMGIETVPPCWENTSMPFSMRVRAV